MSRQAPAFFSLSVAKGKKYTTSVGHVVIVSCKKETIANQGSSVVVRYTINGIDQDPMKQYEFKKWLHSVLESDPPAPPAPPVPDPPAPQPPVPDLPAPQPPVPDPPVPQPPIPPVPPQDPPEPKKRGFWDFLDDIYDWLFE